MAFAELRAKMPADWNSLEIAKLAVSCATPIVVGCLGIYIHRVTKRFEHSQWRNQKVIEKRLAIYDELAPHLNDLLCYYTYVGNWRDLDPTAIVAMKRDVDKKIYLAQPLFSPAFFGACMNFMSLCYETYTGWGEDAKLRSKFEHRRAKHPNWSPTWEAFFSDKPSEPQELRQAYKQLMRVFASEVGLTTPVNIPTGRVPGNIK
jgi:hypothetical protein